MKKLLGLGLVAIPMFVGSTNNTINAKVEQVSFKSAQLNSTVSSLTSGGTVFKDGKVFNVIKTRNDLELVKNNTSLNFILYNDIDLYATRDEASYTNEYHTWNPIRNFTGTFDGQGFSIKNAWINLSHAPVPSLSNCYNDTGNYCMGLFGTTSDATIKNLVVPGYYTSMSSTSTQVMAGSLIAKVASPTTVTDVSVSGNQYIYSSHTNTYVGGAIGRIMSGQKSTFRNVESAVSIYTDATISYHIWGGGLVGYNDSTGSSFEQVSYNGTLNLRARQVVFAGGLFGGMGTNTTVENAYAAGSFTAYSANSTADMAGLAKEMKGTNTSVNHFFTGADITAESAGSSAWAYASVFGTPSRGSYTNMFGGSNNINARLTATTPNGSAIYSRTFNAPQDVIENSTFQNIWSRFPGNPSGNLFSPQAPHSQLGSYPTIEWYKDTLKFDKENYWNWNYLILNGNRNTGYELDITPIQINKPYGRPVESDTTVTINTKHVTKVEVFSIGDELKSTPTISKSGTTTSFVTPSTLEDGDYFVITTGTNRKAIYALGDEKASNPLVTNITPILGTHIQTDIIKYSIDAPIQNFDIYNYFKVADSANGKTIIKTSFERTMLATPGVYDISILAIDPFGRTGSAKIELHVLKSDFIFTDLNNNVINNPTKTKFKDKDKYEFDAPVRIWHASKTKNNLKVDKTSLNKMYSIKNDALASFAMDSYVELESGNSYSYAISDIMGLKEENTKSFFISIKGVTTHKTIDDLNICDDANNCDLENVMNFNNDAFGDDSLDWVGLPSFTEPTIPAVTFPKEGFRMPIEAWYIIGGVAGLGTLFALKFRSVYRRRMSDSEEVLGLTN